MKHSDTEWRLNDSEKYEETVRELSKTIEHWYATCLLECNSLSSCWIFLFNIENINGE